jgi:dynein heavy chain
MPDLQQKKDKIVQ